MHTYAHTQACVYIHQFIHTYVCRSYRNTYNYCSLLHNYAVSLKDCEPFKFTSSVCVHTSHVHSYVVRGLHTIKIINIMLTKVLDVHVQVTLTCCCKAKVRKSTVNTYHLKYIFLKATFFISNVHQLKYLHSINRE